MTMIRKSAIVYSIGAAMALFPSAPHAGDRLSDDVATPQVAPLLSLSLEDAVVRGLTNNHDLSIQQREPIIKGAFEQIERGAYNPELFGEFTYDRENSEETARSTEEQFSVEGSEISGVVGLRQSIPLGTTVEATVGVQHTKSTRTPEQQSARLGLTVTQQLLKGLGPRVNLAGIRQGALDTEASRHELKGVTEALVAEIEIAYWRYVAATEAIEVVLKSLEVAEEQLAAIQSRIEVGNLPENERAAAQSEVALRNQALIDAESYKSARRYDLLRLVDPDLPAHRVRELKAISEPAFDEVLETNVDESIKLALRMRPEISEAELRLRRGELETVVTRNGRLPKLELFIQLGKSGYADTFTGSFSSIDGPSYDMAVGLRFSHLLGNRAAKARDRIARATEEQARESVANLRSLVRYDVLIALNELDRSHKQVVASAETSRFREKALEAESARYEVGASAVLAVALAQRDLLQSSIDEIEARVAFRIAKIRLYLAEGSLLERRGLTISA